MARWGSRNKLAVFWGWDQGWGRAEKVGPASEKGVHWDRGFVHACVTTVARCGMRELKGLHCHQSSVFKHLNNFNDDDHIIATHIYWELIDAC